MVTLRFYLILAAAPLQTDVQDPAAIVRHATAAVEDDSVRAVEQRWQRTRARDPANRVAALGLATLAHLTYRDSLAGHLYRIAGIGPAGDRTAGYALLGLAELAAMRDRWIEADSIAGVAVTAGRTSGDAALLAHALVFNAHTRLQTAPPEFALPMLEEADGLLAPEELRVRALSRCVAAQALEFQRDSRGAVQAAREGSALAHRAGALRTAGQCHYASAVSHSTLFEVDSALAAYARAATAYRQARDRVGVASVLWWRSVYHRLFGRLGHARHDALEAVREADATGSWRIAGFASAALARIALAVGDLRQAAEESVELMRLAAMQPDQRLRSIASSVEGAVALQLGDTAAARAAHTAAVEEANRIGWVNGAMGSLLSLFWVSVIAGDSASAYAAIDTAHTWVASAGLRGHDDVLSFLEGTLALRWRSLAESERIFRTRQAGTSSRGARRYVDAARLSEILVRTGRLDEAERELLDAAGALDQWRSSLSDRQLRLQAFQVAPDRADPDIGVASVIAALASEGRLASAFEVVERSRARGLSDRLMQSAALDTMLSEAALPAGAAAVGLDSIRRALPDDATALLEYVTGRGDPTTLFVITRRAARAYVLASQDTFSDRIERFATLLEAGDDPRDLGRELGDVLLRPILADLDPAIRRFVVVADGPLHRLPFDALTMPDGRFVVERYAVTSAPSAAVVARLGERRTTTAPTGMAVLADPLFERPSDAADNPEAFRSAFAGEGGLPRLRGSAREARVISRYSDSVVIRRRADASEIWLKQTALTGFGVVHFATHAQVDEIALSNTALALASGEGEDGFLRPAELANLPLVAELVVLSACRTAGGVLLRGEGVQGLAAPLIAAGARAVAATWWPIGDVATVQLMDDFYGAMAEGLVAGDALRVAKLAALERGAPAREWAAFTLVGDPFAHPRLRAAQGIGYRQIGALAVMVAALLLYGVVVIRSRRAGDDSAPPGAAARTSQR